VLELEVSVQDLLVQDQLSGYIVVVHNRSELSRLERDLARQEKLAAIGRLTASIAHEIRNPLTSIAGSLELLRPSITAREPENRELFDIVFKEIRRLNDLISELRVYTSQKKPRVEVLDLVEFIQETVMLCEADPKNAGTRFQVELPPSCDVRFDPGGLRQVLLNLIINAVQAAPGTWVKLSLAHLGDELHVDVADPGPGIPPELQERIFEPFVSTKNSGTGLGLAVAGHILMAHGGKLELVRSDENGTVMRMIIPSSVTQT
jgi:signal transduction histidine kinase